MNRFLVPMIGYDNVALGNEAASSVTRCTRTSIANRSAGEISLANLAMCKKVTRGSQQYIHQAHDNSCLPTIVSVQCKH